LEKYSTLYNLYLSTTLLTNNYVFGTIKNYSKTKIRKEENIIEDIIIIKIAQESDIPNIAKLFYETIQTINIKDYTQEEIDDWSSWYSDTDKWKQKINEQFFILAQLNNELVGFGSLAKDGYLDYMFVHKEHQRKGIAKKLYNKIEEKAHEKKNHIIYSEVSITAKSFFESLGFEIEKPQKKKSKNKELTNFKMRKLLVSSS
jgi:putative acetyltransferase